MPSVEQFHEQKEKFLLYRSHGELFGTPLSLIREVVPFQSPLRVPNTHKDYLGVVNVRGEVAGVVDLRLWFNDERVQATDHPPQAVLIVESQAGVMGAAVDAIEGVSEISEGEIESPTGIPTTIAEDGMIGIGKFTHGLATLLNLRALCVAVDVVTEHKERRVG